MLFDRGYNFEQVVVDYSLPAQICQHCLGQIDQWYDFKQQCQTSDGKLRQHFLSKGVNMDSVQVEFLPDSPVKQEVLEPLDVSDEHMLLHPECELTVESEDGKEQDEVKLERTEAEEPAKPKQFYHKRKWHSRKRSKNTSKSATPLQFPCKECDSVFTTKYRLTNHYALAHRDSDEPELVCNVCNKRCASRSSYNSHKVIHRQRTYVCDVCGRAYKSTWDLKAHLRSHTGERPYLCSACGKAYTTRGSLSVHLKSHSGEKRHTCPTCSKAFGNRSSLVRHLKIHTGEKPYTCALCDKAFAHKKSLTKHGRVHTREKPFPCGVCGRAFADKWHLTQHLRLHTGERPYVCPLCGQAFTHNVSLREHIRQHNGELWCCDTCGKTYLSRSSLTAHTKQVHS